MKQLLRYFSVGLFSAGIIMLIALFFSDTRDIEDYAAEELIEFIEEDGYHVINNEEYISLTLNSNKENEEGQPEEDASNEENPEQEKEDSANDNTDESKPDESENKEKETDEAEAEETAVTNYTLSIESGMVTSTISSLLEENDIIDNAQEFTAYLDDNDYSLLVQIGTFELSSDMSFYEIAMAITR